MSKEAKQKANKKQKQESAEVMEDILDNTEAEEACPIEEDMVSAMDDATTKKLQAERDEYYDAMLRARADFENYKKRNTAAVATAYAEATFAVAAKFLPVIDNLERALEAMDDASSYKAGVQMVEKQLHEIFNSFGICEIKAAGEMFDPNLHNAVMQVPPEDGEESGIVKTVLQKGYQSEDKVLRHSMVTVTE